MLRSCISSPSIRSQHRLPEGMTARRGRRSARTRAQWRGARTGGRWSPADRAGRVADEDRAYLAEAARLLELGPIRGTALAGALKEATGRKGKPLFQPRRPRADRARRMGLRWRPLLPLIGEAEARARLERAARSGSLGGLRSRLRRNEAKGSTRGARACPARHRSASPHAAVRRARQPERHAGDDDQLRSRLAEPVAQRHALGLGDHLLEPPAISRVATACAPHSSANAPCGLYRVMGVSTMSGVAGAARAGRGRPRRPMPL